MCRMHSFVGGKIRTFLSLHSYCDVILLVKSLCRQLVSRLQALKRQRSPRSDHHRGGSNETKRNEWGERGEMVEIKFLAWENWRNPEKATQTPFGLPRNPHEMAEERIRDPSGERRASNRLRHEAAYFI